MRPIKTNVLTGIFNDFFVDSPMPTNISYMWNFGSLLGATLALQIATGVTLAMHYCPNTDLAFSSVEHIMRDVNSGYIIRYAHANGASMFFILVYLHIARGLYYGSYAKPRVLLWSVGVIILLLLIIIAFLGYVLPWGTLDRAPYGYITMLFGDNLSLKQAEVAAMSVPLKLLSLSRIPASKRIGPHNIDILSVITGNLLGDGYGEKRVNSTRFHIHMSSRNVEYLMFLHKFYSTRNYALSNKPKLSKMIGKHNKVYYSSKFRTYSYSSFNYLYDMFYKEKVKIVPKNIHEYLTPLTLAIWIMDDGGCTNDGLRISTQSFTNKDITLLKDCLCKNFKFKNLKLYKQNSIYNIYFPKSEMALLSE
ncbi:MAG: hypothetical protein EOP34_03045 [Rickettsiales bacterium]|nr:MAG: hypothetical protein EOP34_03045 [Rickettsiales bacterium]